MSLLLGKIPKENWSCSICLELMNGQEDTNGSVCISKRCMHIFHRACIERAIDEQRACPLCRCQIARAFIVDNPEHAEQCRQWESNPEGYTLEAAFFRKYQKTPEEMELLPEDILRPESLHKEAWIPEISSEDKSRYYHECVKRGYTFREILAAEDQVLDSIRDSFAAMRASNSEMFASYAEIRESYARIRARNAQSFKNQEFMDKIIEQRRKQRESSSSSNNPPGRPWGTIVGVILGVFAIVIGIGYQYRDCLSRRFWDTRTITYQNEL